MREDTLGWAVATLLPLLADIRSCAVCRDLPLGPRPVVALGQRARIMIVGQAPGTKVHESGVAWDDPSGDHLRAWLGVDRETFYNRQKFAIVPMGFCYPGSRKGGDAPPRAECAPTWHSQVRKVLPRLELTLLCGMYAQRYYLKGHHKKTLSETVSHYQEYLPKFFALPHPSWRSKQWIKKNPWFSAKTLPELRRRVHALL